ncbi:endo-1,4-beta-xylanase [Streptomyces sp. NBC_00094]|uniref:endo-1,4-beta-xylanase n=1 Tax=Streptomyces sp. NBC_00094 TaxID=2903620 RepID=UPI00225344FA|nr:endo-1,4-beta-xylanase [Streptomyces sp. NBC_00094]MCX5390860.1 endo-1,4-beta-xylanase [Streptomyces sp. NBC_00094]
MLRRLIAAAAVLAAALTPLATTPAAAADAPLRDLAEAHGRYLGTAVTAGRLTGGYADLAAAQFDSITPGNEMKWGSVEPTRGTYDWTGADRVVAFAEAHGQQVRGHTLVWHSQLPGWVSDGTWTADRLRTLMTDHIAAEAGRYKGRIDHWDVVNEPLNEDGTLRQSVFGATLGESYIADAFRAARAADPAAKLYLNDYSTDALGAKSDGMYALVKRLLAQGVPVDGVGFQAHLVLGQVPASLEANLRRFAELGVDVAITELDIRMTLPATEAKLAQQKADYGSVLRACLAVTRCAGVTVWGFTDADSWIPDFFPGQGAATPYDENLAPKPARAGIAEALAPVTPPAPGVCSVTYAVTSQWTGGFTAQVTLRNTGTTPLNGWTVRWSYPAGQRITQAWNTTATQTGTEVTATHLSYNATIPAGGSVAFGFNGTWSGTNPPPTAPACS